MWFSLLFVAFQDSQPASAPAPNMEQVRHAGEVAGLAFTDQELELMRPGVAEQLASLEALRKIPLSNDVAPALRFSPPEVPGYDAAWIHSFGLRSMEPLPRMVVPTVERPARLDDLAFLSIRELSALVRTRKVSCVELTQFFLARLKRLDPKLLAVVTLTEERALEKARIRDSELEHGIHRGYLHGIPYGAKDLLAVAGYPTTWGSRIYAAQRIERDAAVIEALDEAGAVLIAKLSLGELAMGDQWFGGMTRNPWKLEQGSSGSSAGSSSAVAAGCVPFAIGSETLGSIVSPSTRCGCSSIRPTFGLVDTRGAMALSWSMDKLGPICRSVEDAAIVLQAIAGEKREKRRRRLGKPGEGLIAPATGVVPLLLPQEWEPRARPFERRKIGYLAEAFEKSKRDQHVLDELKALGAELVPIELPKYPVWDMMVILTAEAAASFDELTADGRDDQMVDQSKDGWPNTFRIARLIPATDYIRANRLRSELRREMEQLFESIDVIVHPSFGEMLGIGNLVGYPTVVAPSGFDDDGTPYSISFTGGLYDDTNLLDVARNWQLSTEHHKRHPQFE
jgi:Asp-tRNA(Asn)/Glu-tRNA(Gln) amidotransferase A subunit family amidase